MDEVQYCVILREGPDKGLRHYVWATKKKVENVMKALDRNYHNILEKEGVVSFTDPDWKISFTKRNGEILLGSLEIKAENLESAVRKFKDLSGGPYPRA